MRTALYLTALFILCIASVEGFAEGSKAKVLKLSDQQLYTSITLQSLLNSDLTWRPEVSSQPVIKITKPKTVYQTLRNIASCAHRYELFRLRNTPVVYDVENRRGTESDSEPVLVDFYVDGKIIVDADIFYCMEGVHPSIPDFNDLNETMQMVVANKKDKEFPRKAFEAYNGFAKRLSSEVQNNLNWALSKSSCSFKDNDFSKLFPEFERIDKFWWNVYGSAFDTSIKNWNKKLKNRPKSITRDEFVKRMSCLGKFEVRPASFFMRWKAQYDPLNAATQLPADD